MGAEMKLFKAAVGTPVTLFNWKVIIPSIPLATVKAQTTQIPGVRSTAMEVFHLGKKVKFAGPEEYDNTWTVSIIESQVGDVYKGFQAWRMLMYPPGTDQIGDPAIYKQFVTLHCMTNKGIPWLSIVLSGAYPEELPTVDLDKSNNTEVLKWELTFSYDEWDPLI